MSEPDPDILPDAPQSDLEILPDAPIEPVGVSTDVTGLYHAQSDPEILPDVSSDVVGPSTGTGALGTRHSTRERQQPITMSDFVMAPSRSVAAQRKAELRAKQTSEQKAAHAAAEAQRRADETPEQRAIRLGKKAVIQAEHRTHETPEQKAVHAAAEAKRRADETSEQTAKRRETERLRHQARQAAAAQNIISDAELEKFFIDHPDAASRTRGDYARARVQQYALHHKEAARAARQRRREEHMQQPEVIGEEIRVGGPKCDINDHLNYATGTGTNPLQYDDIEHLLEEVMNYTKPDLAEQWAQAVKLEERMKERMFDTAPCACCGERKPFSTMTLEITEDHEPDVLSLLVSEVTPEIRYPTRVTLLTGRREYAIHDSYQDKPHVAICIPCYTRLARDIPKVPQLCVKTVDVGPWPTTIIDGVVTPFKKPTLIERIVISPVVTTKYVTTGYDVDRAKSRPAGHLTGHITAFPSAMPGEVGEALERFFPMSIRDVTSVQQIVLVTAASAAEARGKAKHIPGMDVSGFWVKLWCEHMQKTYEEYGIQDEMVSSNISFIYYFFICDINALIFILYFRMCV